MSAVGHCGDNAACEGFFGLLKRERVHRMSHPTLDAARADMFEYIERFHTPRMRRREGRQARPEVLSPFTTVRDFGVEPLCSALSGVVCTFYMLSGYSLHAQGLELDAIAAVVIGGTLLAGGSGYVIGTLVGVLMLGAIQTLIVFDGTLNSWWTRIVIGALLLVFCLLQRLLTRHPRTTGEHA